MTRQIEPERAVERYLNERRADISESTYYNHSSLLSQFIEWCEAEGLDYVNELDGFHISDFKIHRRDEGWYQQSHTLQSDDCPSRLPPVV